MSVRKGRPEFVGRANSGCQHGSLPHGIVAGIGLLVGPLREAVAGDSTSLAVRGLKPLGGSGYVLTPRC